MSDVSTLDRPASGREAAAPVPLGLLAEITHRCPLQCPYCSNPLELTRPDAELTAAEWARVFNDAAAMGALQVHISGGEPLARPDAEEIVRAARGADLYVNLITAAVGMTPQRADALVEAGVDHVQVSLQDADAEGCAAITGMRGSFQKKVAACRLVVERGLPLTLNAVVHRRNIDNVALMIELAVSLGAHRLEVANTQYYGWALANRAALMPTREQVGRAAEVVREAREALRGRLLIDYVEPDYYSRYPKPCIGGWGNEFFVVAPSGDVLPCHAAGSIPELTFDNVRERPLAEIWQSGEAFERFRGTSYLKEPCRSCDRRELDFGGCRCQAMLATGDPRNTDPVCTLSPFRGAIDVALAEAEAQSANMPFEWRRYRKVPSDAPA